LVEIAVACKLWPLKAEERYRAAWNLNHYSVLGLPSTQRMVPLRDLGPGHLHGATREQLSGVWNFSGASTNSLRRPAHHCSLAASRYDRYGIRDKKKVEHALAWSSFRAFGTCGLATHFCLLSRRWVFIMSIGTSDTCSESCWYMIPSVLIAAQASDSGIYAH
jgi:hypothetical protein